MLGLVNATERKWILMPEAALAASTLSNIVEPKLQSLKEGLLC
jgi:hypothetical protein